MQEEFVTSKSGLLDVSAVAKLLSISVWTVRAYIHQQRINSVKLGRRRLVPASEIDRIVNFGLLPPAQEHGGMQKRH